MRSLNDSSVGAAIAYGKEVFKASGLESWNIDAFVLLSHATGLTKEKIIAFGEYELSYAQIDNYLCFINKRLEGCPVQYITNKAEFMGISFYVDENVLIPRPDTETLAELLVKTADRYNKPKILDLCTGSGCIAVSAAYYIKEANVTGTDISKTAIVIARRNAQCAGVSGRTVFYVSDLFNEIKCTGFDIIVSNPPYIPDDAIKDLERQVAGYEPHTALGGGADGLRYYKEIIPKALMYLEKGGTLIFEIGYNQAGGVHSILEKHGYDNIRTYKDLAGFDRVVSSTHGG